MVVPEAEEFQVHLREKERQERKHRAERYSLRQQFWTQLLAHARTKSDLHSNRSPGEYHWLGAGSGSRGLSYNYGINQDNGSVELYIDRGKGKGFENKAIFDNLAAKRQEIEKVFGEPLDWQRLDDKRACLS